MRKKLNGNRIFPQFCKTFKAQFSVQFPSAPETRTRTLSIAEQSTDCTIFRVQDNTGFYAVAYTDLTPETIELGADAVIDSIENFLTEELDWSALNGRGKPIEVHGYPTRQHRIHDLLQTHFLIFPKKVDILKGLSTEESRAMSNKPRRHFRDQLAMLEVDVIPERVVIDRPAPHCHCIELH